MPHVQEFAQVRTQLADLIRSRDCALFLGAGASASSGAPLTPDLVDRVRARFPSVEIEAGARLLELGSAIGDTPPHSRIELVRFIQDELRDLEPSPSYKQLPRVRWRVLFTTNYDDLIEKAYATPARVQSLRPIAPSEFKPLIPRERELFLFYLMGSIKARPETDDSPVVSWGDYLRSVQQRAPVMDLICNTLADDGRVIYVGYSFNDFLLDGVLDEALRKVGVRNLAYGFAIIDEWPDKSGQPYHKIESRKVIPVEGTFEQFAELIEEIADGGGASHVVPGSPPASPASGKVLTVGGKQLRLSEVEAGVFSEMFEVLDDSELQGTELGEAARVDLARSFLRGRGIGWLPFRQGWVFRRTAYEKVLEEVRQRCDSVRPQDNCVLLVHGPAGLGKSVMARQLAYDAYSTLQVPVLFAKPSWRSRPDLKILNRFCLELENQLPEGVNLQRLLLVVDEAELLDSTVPFRILSYLRGQGRAVIVVLFARTNEYFRMDEVSPVNVSEMWGGADSINVPEKLTSEEARRLIEHIAQLGVWQQSRITDQRFWQSFIESELKYSFFDTLYSLVEQTQQPLEERVWSEYQNLSYLGKTAYLLISATHQFGLPLKMEILQRALGVVFAQFEEAVIRSDARDVLISESQSSDLNVFFRGRTRIISRIVFDKGAPDRLKQLELFKTIVGATNPNDMFGLDELDALRTLLVQVFGSHGFDRRFTPDEVAQLFEIATSQIEDDVLEHHYGLIQLDRHQLLSARSHLEKALHLSSVLPYDLATLRESPQNIENSLAKVIGELGLEALKRNNREEAAKLFEEARHHFKNARAGRFPNAAAYDAHTRMLRTRAQKLFGRGSPDRTLALSEALDVVAEGIDNVNDSARPELVALQSEILEELGYEDEALTALQERAKKGPPVERARYYVLLARLLTNLRGATPKKKNLNRALGHATLATELDPGYFYGWKLRADIYSQLHPRDYGTLVDLLMKALERAEEEADSNCWLLYKLATAHFYLERYDASARDFRRLSKASHGHENCSGILEIAGADHEHEGDEFTGRVRRASRGGFCIESEELAPFGEIYFNPRPQKYYTARLGDNVMFLVGFNYRGLVATDLKKI